MKYEMPNSGGGMTRGETEVASTGETRRQDCPRCRAFTLIELLVTIAIIGVLAALVLPLSGIASTKMRISRVKAEMNRYVNAIENYKLETGEYPPDNGDLFRMSTNTLTELTNYWTFAALNPLFYELSGTIYSNRSFITVGENEVLNVNFLKPFKRTGIRNSARNKQDIDFKGFSFKSGQYAQLKVQTYSAPVQVLKVPVKGPFMIEGEKEKINPWFYDASSTNRHNKNSFDLWAQIEVQGQTTVIGNWKQ